ncbi:MAG: alpha/beta hydrolase [Oscillospiraceae bacterium]|nr:alpha/beta hydrolase [Oscillospiraceae bacterium]MBR6982297.1 alpha/beta hydrolase [Ruminococcus sp.]
MNFITYGGSEKKSVMLIHGMASSAHKTYFEVVTILAESYHVILCELDGHEHEKNNDFKSVSQESSRIEEYISKYENGSIYAVCGFSLGASVVIDLLQRGNIKVNKTILDAACVVDVGIAAPLITLMFMYVVDRLKKKKQVPSILMDNMFGKDNPGFAEMLEPCVSLCSVRNICREVYHYKMDDRLRKYSGAIEFWCGAREQWPIRSADMIKKYLPQLKVHLFEKMGHGQYLYQYPADYAERIKKFLSYSGEDQPYF